MAIQTALVFLSPPASPAEVRLVDETLDSGLLDVEPERLIGDKAFDSDPPDERLLLKRGIEMISPNPRNRKKRTQGDRPLRRYRHRWNVERLFAWLHNF